MSLTSKFLPLAGAVLVAVAIAQPAQASVVSFESALGNGGYTYSSTANYPSAPSYFATPVVDGVTFTGMSGIQSNGSAWGFTNAPDGNQTAFLQSYSGVSPQGATISFQSSLLQSLVVGQTYDLSFYVEGRPGGGTPFSVDVGGSSTLFGAPGTSSWVKENVLFTALGTSTPITFNVNGQSDADISIGLDKISVSAVPEPATWAMMILGFLGIGFMSYRRKTPSAFRLV